MDTTVIILGTIMLLTGLVLRYLLNRRRFNRRNFAAVETFNSYEHRTVTRIGEKAGRYIAWALILAGVFFLFVAWYNHHTASNYRKQKEHSALESTVKRR